MHMVFALLCFVVVIHWLIFPYPSGLLDWHCGNLTIAPVPAKQPWWIWMNASCEFIMNDCITTTKQSTTKPCAYFLGYTVYFKVLSSVVSCLVLKPHWDSSRLDEISFYCGNTRLQIAKQTILFRYCSAKYVPCVRVKSRLMFFTRSTNDAAQLNYGVGFCSVLCII